MLHCLYQTYLWRGGRGQSTRWVSDSEQVHVLCCWVTALYQLVAVDAKFPRSLSYRMFIASNICSKLLSNARRDALFLCGGSSSSTDITMTKTTRNIKEATADNDLSSAEY